MPSHFTPITPSNAAPIPFHQCTSHTDGDWTVWRCPLCAGYERRFNWVTSEMRVRKGGSTAPHSGMAGAGNGMAGAGNGMAGAGNGMEALTMGLCSN